MVQPLSSFLDKLRNTRVRGEGANELDAPWPFTKEGHLDVLILDTLPPTTWQAEHPLVERHGRVKIPYRNRHVV